MPENPLSNSRTREISTFLEQADKLPARRSSAPGRLIFALDATASRQPTWDRACELQGEMFLAIHAPDALSIQLCHYRGFREFRASPWLSDATSLLTQMRKVQCLGGHTQIERLLRHCIDTHREQAVRAVVFVGDAIEEDADTLCQRSGELGLLGLPLLVFQEGNHPRVRDIFQQMARLSGGAWARFDGSSASELAQLLRAAAVFASAGHGALASLDTPAARQLLGQLAPGDRT